MVYALHKSKDYLFGTRFVFYVDHITLVYLVNKPQVSSIIARWLLLFLEYDFKIVYKPSRSHLMANALSRLPNQTESVGVPDETTDVHMFTIQPKWLQNIYDYMLEGMMLERFTISQRQYLAQKIKLFVLQNGVLYKFRQDNKFHCVLQLKQVLTIL